MNKLYALFLFLITSHLQAVQPEKPIKLLVLIISSDNRPIYLEFEKLWRSYMHLNPEHVEAYFLKASQI